MRLEPLIRKSTIDSNLLTLNNYSVPFQLRNFSGPKWDVRTIYIPRSKEIKRCANYCIGFGIQFILEIPRRYDVASSIYCKYRIKFYYNCIINEETLDEELNKLIKSAYLNIYMVSNFPDIKD